MKEGAKYVTTSLNIPPSMYKEFRKIAIEKEVRIGVLLGRLVEKFVVEESTKINSGRQM